MMKEAIEKGHYGYIDRRKKNQLIKTLICAVVIVFLAGLGYMIFGTKLNFIMVPAMLMVIPMANFFVAFAGLAAFDTASAEHYAAVRAYDEQGMLLSDLVVVNAKGARMHAEFAVVYKNGVIAYSYSRKWKPGDIELTINDILQRRGIPMRMKVYSNWEEFMERINGLEAPDSESEKRVSMAKEAVLSACL